jgi:hypothetical protein
MIDHRSFHGSLMSLYCNAVPSQVVFVGQILIGRCRQACLFVCFTLELYFAHMGDMKEESSSSLILSGDTRRRMNLQSDKNVTN